jgi:ASC-1-like (ASCH) protein
MKWKDKLIDNLKEQLVDDIKWRDIIDKIVETQSIGVHLAIFTEPFLSLVCSGEKSIESRFSQAKIAPFDRVNSGDVVLVKESGGYVKALFIVGAVKFYTFLNSQRFIEIEKTYGKLICSHYDLNFWESRLDANFATLMEIKDIRVIKPFPIGKNDRTGWVTLKLGYSNTLFNAQSQITK